MKPETLNSFALRADRVVRLITEHLDESLSLEQLADAAALSTFHFHRVWRAAMGEPVMDTVRRLKLERAAHWLATTNRPITDIALQTGFESSQSFAHAFRQMMGCTPTEARAGLARVTAPQQDRAPEATMSVEIVSMEPFAIIAKRHTGPYTAQGLGPTFGLVWAWAKSRELVSRCRGIYGVPLDDAASVPPENVRYDAGFDFGLEVEPGSRLHRVPLGGWDAARVRVRGAYSGLGAAEDFLYRAWLESGRRELADAPLVYHFHNDPDVTPEADLTTDIYLPLAR
jgi:AraC family transcriptional regulator